MDHIAIDLGARESQVCIRNSAGDILLEQKRNTAYIPRLLTKRPKSRVVFETGAEAFRMADAALDAGHEVRVVPCSLSKSLGVGARGIKTDQRDARLLSAASCRMDLPSVHIPSEMSRRRKSLCGMREALVDARTKLINTVHGWCRTTGLRVRRGTAPTFAARVLLGQSEQALQLPDFVLRQLEAIDGLTKQIREADKELKEHAKMDSLCQRLMSVPGVGPVTAVRFLAAVDEVGRFKDAHSLESYLGLVPGEHSSSQRKRRTSITKAGPSKLRWALMQSSWSARRTRVSDPMVLWCMEVEKRRGKRIAQVALARKMAGILYAIWRDGTVYSPKH